ncbi:hypothetical protein Anas_03390 [Armadillidium nasatum]|uniref:Uncharacterized protein n=1 Tax=Armadillidium nasatum TaxID=96803 RepID=A0A5N5TJG8_9CRUS|nr:hypothetical protein Anas_03390 [Armadillidium nasatum]
MRLKIICKKGTYKASFMVTFFIILPSVLSMSLTPIPTISVSDLSANLNPLFSNGIQSTKKLNFRCTHVHLGDPIILDCRTTSPDIKVNLLINKKQILDNALLYFVKEKSRGLIGITLKNNDVILTEKRFSKP